MCSPSLRLLTRFNRWKFFKQVFGENDEVLDIDYAITPRHGADITERIIRPQVVNNNTHVSGVHERVAVEIDNRYNWRLPQVETTILSTVIAQFEV